MDRLRKVDVDGYILEILATNQTDWRGQTKIAYKLTSPKGEAIFDGSDFCGSPMHADESDETLACLLGFLTLRFGDTDQDYFADYTERQLAFVENEAESLSLWAMDERDGRPAFIDLE